VLLAHETHDEGVVVGRFSTILEVFRMVAYNPCHSIWGVPRAGSRHLLQICGVQPRTLTLKGVNVL
jgi:hypothetical protein